MATASESSVSFEETDTRSDEMNSTIEQWIDDLVAGVDDAQASAEFQEWLDVQSRFHDYSYRNTLLIKQQCPEATRVAGYRTWQEEFDRHVKEGESAIWIWASIITKQCPECENSPSYHEDSDCEYDETPPEEWSEGLVGSEGASGGGSASRAPQWPCGSYRSGWWPNGRRSRSAGRRRYRTVTGRT